MLVGDSMANSIAPGLERLAAEDGFEFFNASVPGCGLMSERSEVWVGYWQAGDPDGRCIAWRDRWPRDVALWDPDVVVALFGGHETQDHRIDGQVFHFDAPEGQSLALSELTDLRRSLTSSGARIVFLTSPYSIQAWPHPVDRARSGYNNRWIDRWNDFLPRVCGRGSAACEHRRSQPAARSRRHVDGSGERGRGARRGPRARLGRRCRPDRAMADPTDPGRLASPVDLGA